MKNPTKIPKIKRTWTDDEIARWGADHPVGTAVRYWSIRGQPEHVDTQIRSEPWRLGDGSPVVKIEGLAGGVSLDHLTKLDTATVAASAAWDELSYRSTRGGVREGASLESAWNTLFEAVQDLQATTRAEALAACDQAPLHIGQALQMFYAQTGALTRAEKHALIVELMTMAAMTWIEDQPKVH